MQQQRNLEPRARNAASILSQTLRLQKAEEEVTRLQERVCELEEQLAGNQAVDYEMLMNAALKSKEAFVDRLKKHEVQLPTKKGFKDIDTRYKDNPIDTHIMYKLCSTKSNDNINK